MEVNTLVMNPLKMQSDKFSGIISRNHVKVKKAG